MLKKLAIATAVSIALSGCGTEEREYKLVDRPAEEITVNSLDKESLWVYMPSTGAASRYAITQRGNFQGTPKLVTLKFDEKNGIVVSQVDRDKVSDANSRWNDDINTAPVLQIPGKFRQYRCRENSFRECSNVEEINTDEGETWKDATHFVPDYVGIKSLARDTVDTWYTSDNAVESAAPRLTHWEYDAEKGVINVEVERTFTANPRDQYQFGPNLEDLSFKTRFFYSIVKLDKLASSDYNPVYLPSNDSVTYGFFKDQVNQKTAIGESDRQGQKYSLINRFNPKKKSIDYYLSDSYHQKGNEKYLEATIATVADMNKTLKGTGVPTIKIVNTSAPAGIHTGDLRYNSLNLVTDPVDNGLLGYGPSATNPLTGEILHAHVNQYAGVIKSLSRRTWSDLVKRYNREEIIQPEEFKPETGNDGNSDGSEGGESTINNTPEVYIVNDNKREISVPHLSETLINKIAAPTLTHQAVSTSALKFANKQYKAGSFEKAQADNAMRLDNLAKHNAYSTDFMWVSTQAKGLVEGIDYLQGGYFSDKENKILKDWGQLSEAQQAEVSEALSLHMFRSTLVHEFGHNLGLRHNFSGSVDKANFYKEEEYKAIGAKKQPAYSSIMDYAASTFDELPMYGKYDVAALRFGYGREIEVLPLTVQPTGPVDPETPPVVPERKYLSLDSIDEKIKRDHKKYPLGAIAYVRENLQTEYKQPAGTSMKTYQYCTDEHTYTSPICNRFDEGTNIFEITQFRIQRYEDSYDTMNKRNGRDSFYDYHQFYYTLNRAAQFAEIRDVVEQVEAIDYQFAQYLGVNDSQGRVFGEIYDNSCLRFGRPVDRNLLSPTLRSLCNIYDATKTAADFFVKIVKQPDHVCELVEKSGVEGVPNRVRFATLSDLWRTYGRGLGQNKQIPTTCYDADLVAELKAQPNEIVINGETRDGRIQANLQANNPYQNTASAIDLLGTWPDKLLAAKMLVKRDSQYVSTERSNIALIDIGTTVQDVLNHMSYLSGNESIRQPIFVDAEGKYVDTINRYKPTFSKKLDAIPDYLWQIQRYFGLTARDNYGEWYNPSVPNAPTPYFSALLTNLISDGQANEFGLSDSAEGFVDALTLTKAGPGVDLNDAITFSWKARNYVASRRNTMAQAMAKRALYTPEAIEMVDALNNVHYRVRNALAIFNDTRGSHEAAVLTIGDKDVIELFRETTGFRRFFLITSRNFTVKKDEDTGLECWQLKVSGETEFQRKARKCNIKSDLENALTNSLDKISDERLAELMPLIEKYGSAVVYNSNYYIKSVTKHNKVYSYPPSILRNWSSREYVDYRRAFQQIPIK